MNNIYLLYGSDLSLINNKIKELIVSFKVEENNIIKYDIEQIDNIIEETTTIGLFSNQKLLLIDSNNYINKIDNITLLEEYLKNKQDDNILIFTINSNKIDNRKKIVKQISEKGKLLELKKDHNFLSKYVVNYLKEYQITNDNIDYFLSLVGTNLDNIINELDKIMLYKIEEKKITKEDIKLIVSTNLEEEIFALTDSVIKNNIDKSLELYHDFLSKNYEQLQIIALLANQIRLLYQVKRLTNTNKSNDEIAKILEVHPYRVKLAKETNYNYTESDYLKYLKKLANYDKDIKLGNINKDLFELFLINKDM